MIGTERSDQFHIPATAHAGHLGAECLGNLDREGAHASRRSVDQDLLSRLELSAIAKSLQRGKCRHVK